MINIKDRKIYLVVYFSVHVFCFTQSNHLYYHKNPSPVEAGKPIQISLVLFEDQYIESGMLYFRDKGELSYQEVVMNYDNANWIGIIPGHRVSLNDIEYVTIFIQSAPSYQPNTAVPIPHKIANNNPKPLKKRKADLFILFYLFPLA